jgi:adenine-specific DNA-methyltransferase
MAPAQKRKVENYTHPEQKRINNPPVGLVTPQTDRDAGKKTYAYDPHLDPTLQWAGKTERTSFDISTVSLHVHERIDPRSIIEAVRKKNGEDFVQGSLFSMIEENPPLREAIEFYKHKHNWSNRLIAGDSLLVMNSLLEKEGMAGKVQMAYIDPPYGISYGSNFQPFVDKREVKDRKDEDLTAEPEMIKAFRDTWELGLHSYLSFLRDRLFLVRDLLTDSGSVFVQISDENVHHVREILDEVFTPACHVVDILVKKKGSQKSSLVDPVNDYLLWYSKTPREAGGLSIGTSTADGKSIRRPWRNSGSQHCLTGQNSRCRRLRRRTVKFWIIASVLVGCSRTILRQSSSGHGRSPMAGLERIRWTRSYLKEKSIFRRRGAAGHSAAKNRKVKCSAQWSG